MKLPPLLLSFCLLALVPAQAAAPGPKRAPSAKHVKAELACTSCHPENPPAKAPKQAVCISCHGDLAAMATATKALPINPHDSHMDDPDCTKCHRQHRPPVVKCLECHNTFKLNPK